MLWISMQFIKQLDKFWTTLIKKNSGLTFVLKEKLFSDRNEMGNRKEYPLY